MSPTPAYVVFPPALSESRLINDCRPLEIRIRHCVPTLATALALRVPDSYTTVPNLEFEKRTPPTLTNSRMVIVPESIIIDSRARGLALCESPIQKA